MTPLRAWGPALAVVGGLGVLLAFGALDGSAVNTHQNSSQASPATPTESDIAFELAVLGAKELKRAMRNPDSFKLTGALLMPDGAACYEYRSQNGFGGMNVGKAVLSPNGTIRTSEMSGFSQKWNHECANKTGDEKAWEVGYAAGFHGMFDKD